jgi:hypothetical protein
MAVSLVKIDRACKVMPGLYQVWVQSAAVLSATPPHELGILLNQSLPAGFVAYQFDRSSAQYEAKDRKSDAGILVEQSLRILLNKSDITNLRALDLLRRVQDPVIVFKDKNGQFRLMGTKYHPCLPLNSETSGARVGDRNGFEVSFSALVPLEAFAYTGELPTPTEVE